MNPQIDRNSGVPTPVAPAPTGPGRRALARCRLATAGMALATAGLMLLPDPAAARAAPDSFADLAAKLSPSVVNISTTQTTQAGPRQQPEFNVPPGSPLEEFFKEFMERNRRGPARRATSLGSGFIVDPSGLVVTNNHVISEADEISVRLSDGSRYEAELKGRDPKTDLALLQIKADRNFPALRWGDSTKSRVGDWVLAIGNPFGFGGSVTAGIISARGRDIQSGPYDDFIQTDASINRGNSGGPLFNMDGEIIGINTAIVSPTGGSVGIGFAIPSSLARNVIHQLSNYGRTKRGWLGVRIQTVTDEIAEGLGLKEASGALVAGVSKGGPAEAGGVLQGDVILTFDGKEVTEMRALPRIVAETEIGKSVGVGIWRKGQEMTVSIMIGELEESPEQVAAIDPETATSSIVETLGMTLAAVTPELREKYELSEDATGVVVTDVAEASAAAEKGIRPGDMIVEVQQDEVVNPEQVVEKVKAVQKQERKSVLLLLRQRAGELRFVAVRLKDG